MKVEPEHIELMRRYLQRHGWAVYSQNGNLEVWAKDGSFVNVLVTPNSMADTLWMRAVNQIATTEGRSPAAVISDMSETRLGRIEIYFDGRPVNEQGIQLQFATKGLDTFRQVIETIRDASARGPLKETGRRGAAAPMRIAGVLEGSFGFALIEDGVAPPLFDDRSPLADAMDGAADLLRALADPDSLDVAIAETEPRVINRLKDFVARLRIDGASIKVVSSNQQVTLRERDIEEADRTLGATRQTELMVDYEGVFAGALPGSREFEFDIGARLEHGEPVVLSKRRTVKGKLHAQLEPKTIRSWLHDWVGKTRRVRMRVVRTTRNGVHREAYWLCGMWGLDDEPPGDLLSYRTDTSEPD